MRERLLEKSWEELYQIRCDMYRSKEEIADDILERDDGSVREMLQTEGSFLWLMLKSSGKNGFKKLLDVSQCPCKERKKGEESGGKIANAKRCV